MSEDGPLPALEPSKLRSVLESLLLVVDRPLTAPYLATFLDVDVEAVRNELEQLHGDLVERGSGIRLARIGGGYRLRTAAENAEWVQALTGRRPMRLSRAALESLAIIAYRQPATRSEIEDVRGVDSSVVLRSLLEKDLLRIVGRREEPGRPMLYGTTRRFLGIFGLDSLSDLPSLREFTDLSIGEQDDLFVDRPLETTDESNPTDEPPPAAEE